MINQNREHFQYRGGCLVNIISPLTSQLGTNSQKIAIKYVGSVVIYKMIYLHNYLLMTLDRAMLRGIFEHERLKPAVIRTNRIYNWNNNLNILIEGTGFYNIGFNSSITQITR